MSVLELVLADGRFPGGGFAHSGGLEAAVAEGAVGDVASLHAYAEGRLHSSGPLEAWLAAQAARAGADAERLAQLEAEAEAHQPAPALRAATRAQGRGLRRVAALLYPHLDLGTIEVQPVVVGRLAAVAGLTPHGAARVAVSAVFMTVLSAAPKLMAIDMADAMGIALQLAPDADAIVARVADAPRPPACSAPLSELRAGRHVTWEVRLFVS